MCEWHVHCIRSLPCGGQSVKTPERVKCALKKKVFTRVINELFWEMCFVMSLSDCQYVFVDLTK